MVSSQNDVWGTSAEIHTDDYPDLRNASDWLRQIFKYYILIMVENFCGLLLNFFLLLLDQCWNQDGEERT